MKNKYFLFATYLLLFTTNSCNTTDPPDGNNGKCRMDTTSHLINWVVEDIGEIGSILQDVETINDTLIYVVGDIYKNDTLYNLGIWNGQ